MSKQDFGTPFTATNTGSTTTTATVTGVTGLIYYVTDVSGSSDKATATIQIKDGSTVIWQDAINATSYNHTFSTPLACTTGATLTVVVTGTAASNANVSGYSLNAKAQ